MSDATVGSGRVRASDAEREEYARRVREAVGEGRLTLDEGDERLTQVYAARFRDELRPVVADLPGDGRDERRPEPWRGHGRRDVEGHWRRRGPGRHLAFVAVVAAALVGLWVLSGAHVFWPAIILAFLAVGLLKRLFWWRYWSRHRSAR